MRFPVENIAALIVSAQTDTDRGEVVTNLKLQKLLYYVQGFHLAFFGEPLFDDRIEAWTYGPVVPAIYHKYKMQGRSGIEVNPEEDVENHLSPEQNDMLQQVLAEYGKFSAVRLMEMTHTEKPWMDAYGKANLEISVETMKNYFDKLVDEE